MRANVIHRRAMTAVAQAGSAQNDEELCSICGREDNTAKHKLINGCCSACYSWWRTLSLRSEKELSVYRQALVQRTERFEIRANILGNQRSLLPNIQHKPQQKPASRPVRL